MPYSTQRPKSHSRMGSLCASSGRRHATNDQSAAHSPSSASISIKKYATANAHSMKERVQTSSTRRREPITLTHVEAVSAARGGSNLVSAVLRQLAQSATPATPATPATQAERRALTRYTKKAMQWYQSCPCKPLTGV